ncbi:MAG: 3-methyl-2-oxobutanoate hydroxymethyltransferase [Chloroflexi bacterium]|nr:3-methyl-2-oxobutanoate hydroxymethyltransferase [Chloroflexota bacterium]
MLTCYDYPTAVIQDEAGIDVIFVGDSVGTNVLGYASPRDVTLEDMVHHVRAVRRGVVRAYLLADLPFGTYESPESAWDSAQRLRAAGADGVKLEGGAERSAVVSVLSERGVEVCGHIGFTPQTAGPRARVQGRTTESALELVRSARALQAAGAFMVVLELIPAEIARVITEDLQVPTIGIGAGPFCSGQVQIFHDMVGITPFSLRHAHRFAHLRPTMLEAVAAYRDAVTARAFPGAQHSAHTDSEELERLRTLLAAQDSQS